MSSMGHVGLHEMLTSQLTSGVSGFIPRIASQMFALIRQAGEPATQPFARPRSRFASSPSPPMSEASTSRSIG